ncbi:MAG: hypothetical protein SCALA702_11790 [Melioribacteraceae bacterium]|nr:MAG: hypothetical protein SCALA702_11790 [Melioribacteraceae bacterium]
MKKYGVIIGLLFLQSSVCAQNNYPVVDTRQTVCFDSTSEISVPAPGERFYGQDAQFTGNQPSYSENETGIITDNVTGLMWQKDLLDLKYTYDDMFSVADTFSLGGYDDWRIPTIKELYSLILFDGKTGMSAAESIPYLDTDYFEFRFGDEYNSSDRFIDAQYATTSVYVSTTMNNEPTVFGVNFADGRIKGYPQSKEFEIKLVRGNVNYGMNNFVDNGNGTITDLATSLMWDQHGTTEGKSWEEALAWVQELNSNSYLGYNDWRLPNAKELQSLLDYSVSPITDGVPAINSLFNIPQITVEDGTSDYPFYWTSTTHEDGPTAQKAVYICFGTAYGFMEMPPMSGNYTFMDVHGAGAQRSDPKTGDPDDYPNGFGPQGDVIRIYNYARAVRDYDTQTGVNDTEEDQLAPDNYSLGQNYPNPFNPSTTISFSLSADSDVNLRLYDTLGREVEEFVSSHFAAGTHMVTFNARGLSSGIYIYQINAQGVDGSNFVDTRKMMLMK